MDDIFDIFCRVASSTENSYRSQQEDKRNDLFYTTQLKYNQTETKIKQKIPPYCTVAVISLCHSDVSSSPFRRALFVQRLLPAHDVKYKFHQDQAEDRSRAVWIEDQRNRSEPQTRREQTILVGRGVHRKRKVAATLNSYTNDCSAFTKRAKTAQLLQRGEQKQVGEIGMREIAAKSNVTNYCSALGYYSIIYTNNNSVANIFLVQRAHGYG
ncbi:hypothetical protein ANN_11112 [Periplaneta americana]|uniref:Uncharacterized protein n=1 Tax=Periplaneta americana TaxID=6978 RepID=A0ABQ8T5N1_PERAM|nr:hypothetical protein ANN_11112 [Periplaneta americana]